MPNVTGAFFGVGESNQYVPVVQFIGKGIFKQTNSMGVGRNWGLGYSNKFINSPTLDLNLSYMSNQYQNISEVRVKSIISIGLIKLY